MASEFKYKAFISYKHSEISRMHAVQLESALKRYARPIFAPPIKIYRDEQFMVAGNDLPALITDGLKNSEYLLYFAEKEAAVSKWVVDEIEYWCKELKRSDKLIIIWVKDKIGLNLEELTIDWSQTDALPTVLKDYIKHIPLYIDLTWAKKENDHHLNNLRYKTIINNLTALFRNLTPEEMNGKEILTYKKNLLYRKIAIYLVSGLAVIAMVGCIIAISEFNNARKATKKAEKLLILLSGSKTEDLENTGYYNFFLHNGITKFKEGNYLKSLENFEIAKLSTDAPRRNNLDELIDETRTCFNFQQNTIKLMVRVDGGTFLMGSESSSDERPVHKVMLDTFYISKVEVTNQQFADFLNQYASIKIHSLDYKWSTLIKLDGQDRNEQCRIKLNGKSFEVTKGYENFPVAYVTWFGANEFCKFYYVSLPTEAQWEFAACGGTKSTGRMFSGDDMCYSVAWFLENSGMKIHEVSKKISNEIGLHDMSGNVAEWCADWYANYSADEQKNPTGPVAGINKVVRGGSYSTQNKNCRNTYRLDCNPDQSPTIGFRFAKTFHATSIQ